MLSERTDTKMPELLPPTLDTYRGPAEFATDSETPLLPERLRALGEGILPLHDGVMLSEVREGGGTSGEHAKDGSSPNSDSSQVFEYSNFEALPNSHKTEKLNSWIGKVPEIDEIISQGTLDGIDVEFRDGIGNLDDEISMREAFAEMFLKNPSTARTLVEIGAAGVHGTRSVALAGVLELGALMSARLLGETDVIVSTGEHMYQQAGGQGSISFSLMGGVDRAISYSGINTYEQSAQDLIAFKTERNNQARQIQLNDSRRSSIQAKAIKADEEVIEKIRNEPDSLLSQLALDDFPILFGITKDFVRRTTPENPGRRLRMRKSNNYDEFRPYAETIPLDEMFIAVPTIKMGKVKQLLAEHGHNNVVIVPFEDMIPDRYKQLIEIASS